MVEANPSFFNFDEIDLDAMEQTLNSVLYNEKLLNAYVTSYSTQKCFGCKKALNGRGIRIHKPGSLVYTHSLLKYEEV